MSDFFPQSLIVWRYIDKNGRLWYGPRIWPKLNLYFTAQTRATVSQFETLLQERQKCSLYINNYSLKVKNIVDRLATVDHTISFSDHLEAIFNGLLEEYDRFVIFVDSRSEIYTIEIESLLLAQEGRMYRKAFRGSWLLYCFCQFATQSAMNRKYIGEGIWIQM